MRLSPAATVGLVLGLAFVLSACGEDGTTSAGGPPSTERGSSTATLPAAAAPSTAASQRACRHELGPFVASLAGLRDDLARGLSYDDYLARVRGARAVYAKVRPNEVPAGCLVISGGPAERAFNFYIDAANTWGDCLATATCNTRSIEPKLQRKWALAEARIVTAQRGLKPARSD